MHLAVDKYLLPVFLEGDYPRIARYLLCGYELSNYDKDVPFDPIEWLNTNAAITFLRGSLGKF